MGLEMRKKCERCDTKLHDYSVAYICTHECTYCEDCTKQTKHVCPNCQGELVRRPIPSGACPIQTKKEAVQ